MLSVAAMAPAGEQDPQEVLKGKGLRRLSSYFLLSEESQFRKEFRSLVQLNKKLDRAQADLTTRRKAAEAEQKQLAAYKQQIAAVELRLANPRLPAAQHNYLVTIHNGLVRRIEALERCRPAEKALEAARANVTRQTEHYVEHLLQTRILYDDIKRKYENLTFDDTVKAAVEQYSQSCGKPFRLGSSLSFLSYDNRLEALEEMVLSESVPLRKSQSGLLYVSAMVNGKYPVEMMIDTGASLVVLPSTAAESMGLQPDPWDPGGQVKVGDGRIVDVKRMVAQTLRVGKFQVENVECAVMPPNAGAKAPPILGMSFLKHFNFRIDARNLKLIIRDLKAPQTGGRRQPGHAGE